MLSSRKALEPRSLHDLTTRNILLSQSRTTNRPPSFLFSSHREFSWGSKHKNTTSRAGNICKGFSTRDSAGKDTTQKQIYRSVLRGNHHLRRYLPRCAPIQEWRYASSWGKKPETTSSSKERAKVEEEEDWYTSLTKQKQKLRQYDDFMKKIGQDPYTVLFGKSWLNFSWENTEPKANRTQSPTSKETSAPKNEKIPNHSPSKSKVSSTNLSENRGTSGRQSKSERMPIQKNIQEYEIDPITNRKVMRSSASPVSAAGHINVEHPQALSSSSPPNKGIPSVEPHNEGWWLAQEGFGNCREPVADPQPTLRSHDAKSSATATIIESALDRHLSNKSTLEKGRNDRPELQYKPEDVKTEDVDLLRPSDVRASAGLRGNSPKETDLDKQARRQKLEEKYESCSLDRESQLAREAAGNHFVQEREDHPVESSTAPELSFGSWSKLQDAKLKDKEASKDTSAAWVNELSNARDFDPVSVDQTLVSAPLLKNGHVFEPMSTLVPEAHVETSDKASKLKARIVPFKAKLDAMKADYDFLRQQWLQEVRRVKEKAAKKEEEMKAQRLAKRAREMHEEEIKTQKVAMEAMEMRSSHGSINTTKIGLTKGIGNDGEKPAPRRLQSFLQGEGDMASNVHEFAGRDRWYKRKAPHAMDEKDAEIDAKIQKLATDRALIREVRDIYEDTYGTIDTKHRQIHVPDSTNSTNGNSETVTTSSGKVGLHAQLPSTSATESSQDLDETQSSEAMKIIQKLFGQLREAQSIIQDFRCQTQHNLSPGDPKINALKTPDAFEKSLMQIVRTSEQLARIKSAGMIDRGSVGAITHVVSVPLLPKITRLEVQNATKPSTYCILAYDLATQNVKSAEVTTLEPFSKEESLLPLDALSRLNDPGKFLPHVISLGHQGYKPVSATSNIAVFKQEITLQEKVEMKETHAKKEPIPIRGLPDHSPLITDDAIGNHGGSWPLNPISEEEIEAYRPEQLQGLEANQQKVTEAQKEIVEQVGKEHQKVEEARDKAMDRMRNTKQSFEEAQTQQSAPSAPASHTPSDKVHRQETVFSGSRQGRWIDNGVKLRKSKRVVDRRRKIMKRMLMAGGFTAACCYCVGVASEMMHT